MTAPALPTIAAPSVGALTFGENKNSPATRRTESQESLFIWEECRHALVGTRALQSNIARYLPRHPKEKLPDYQRRAAFTAFYNAFGRTVRGIAGMPFAKAPVYGENIPKMLLDHCENIDGEGTHLDMFAHRLFTDGLATGTAGIHVVVPPAGEGLSRAQEEAAGIRPYWVHVAAEDIITWRTQRLFGRRQLTMLSLREMSETDADEFLIELQTKYTVYRLRMNDVSGVYVTSQRFVELTTKDKQTLAVAETEEETVRNASRIPFIPLRLGLFTSELTAVTPLLDLLDMNLQHFRVSSDRNWLMHLACVPVPVKKGSVVNPAGTTGEGARREAWGANVMLNLPVDGDFKYVEPTGSAFEPTGKELQQLEQRMAALGLAFLARDTRAAETAEAKRLDAAAQNATLAACADALDDCIEQAMAVHAEFCKIAVKGKGGELSGGEWSTSRDYEESALTPAMIDTYAKMETAGQLTLPTLWKIMQKLGALPEDFDAKAEKESLDMSADLTITDPKDDPDSDAEKKAAEAAAKQAADDAARKILDTTDDDADDGDGDAA